jgi:putative endonuclease
MEEQELGASAEELVAAVYRSRGWSILGRNCRWPEGELDLVAARPGVVAFVEVRLRGAGAIAPPVETVGRLKRRRVATAALLWLAEQEGLPPRDFRFDVASVYRGRGGVLVQILENAFDVDDAGVPHALV